MPPISPHFLPGHDRTGVAQVAITGGRFVELATGVNAVEGLPQFRHGAAAVRKYGVAAYDRAVGERLLVYRNGCIPVEAGAALAHGQAVEADAAGRAVPLAAGVMLGYCEADTAQNALAPITLALT